MEGRRDALRASLVNALETKSLYSSNDAQQKQNLRMNAQKLFQRHGQFRHHPAKRYVVGVARILQLLTHRSGYAALSLSDLWTMLKARRGAAGFIYAPVSDSNLRHFIVRKTEMPRIALELVTYVQLVYAIFKTEPALMSEDKMIAEVLDDFNVCEFYEKLRSEPETFLEYTDVASRGAHVRVVRDQIFEAIGYDPELNAKFRRTFLGQQENRSFYIIRATSRKGAPYSQGLVHIRKPASEEFPLHTFHTIAAPNPGSTIIADGFVIPMKKAVYFVGALEGGEGLNLFAVQWIAGSGVVTEAPGLMMNIDIAGNASLFSGRILIREAGAAPDLKVESLDELPNEVLKKIENNVALTLRAGVSDDKGKELKTPVELFAAVNASVKAGRWKIRKDSKRIESIIDIDDKLVYAGLLETLGEDCWKYFTKKGRR